MLKLVLLSNLLHTPQFRCKCLLLPALHDKLLTSSLIHDYCENCPQNSCLHFEYHPPRIVTVSKALYETAHPSKVYGG